ncbi:succinate dehydrogenase [Aneurinibacillus sp. Ricciae_BoGa-3]|uniref:succinate dehydrogenase n=1 Tax=Aneurinibacillus sp. Ricciae_BoGa-3 TaxID=3022697 RepID=UPI002340AC43|nr:succinate dehydrogenase [Aneurinibacillus sp. Ricciae_BoGa-3]WCK56352.1 succinate dehydrogenase [Aneurinibacillus sp. Ricciae_BoGa-3]
MARNFLLTRLHSLAGIFPLGLFLIEHLYSNSVAMFGAVQYNQQVERLQSIPFLSVVEIVLIAIPLFYHAVFGLYFAFIARNNTISYSYSRNWMFLLQRLSGVVTLIFIVYHLWVFRIAHLLFGTPIDFNVVHTQLANPWILSFYIIGIMSTTFHFSNGLWGALVTWGITVGPKAQQKSAMLAYTFFLILGGIGIATLFSF